MELRKGYCITSFSETTGGMLSTSMDEVEVKATALHHFKKQAKGLKTTTAALKFRVS